MRALTNRAHVRFFFKKPKSDPHNLSISLREKAGPIFGALPENPQRLKPSAKSEKQTFGARPGLVVSISA
jgi:hypothetical protein